jgi:Flp pilus assembly protein TadB
MAAESWMRAADRDREETVEILRQAYTEGRLDPAELSERTDTAFRARTIGELRDLMADVLPRGSVNCLPSDEAWPPGASPRPRKPPESPRMRFIVLLAALACVVIGAATRNVAVIAVALAAGFGALTWTADNRRAGPR